MRPTEKEAQLGPTVITGYDQNRRATGEARGRLAIDREARSLEDALRDAQLVIVAVPVQSIRAVFSQIAPLLPNGAVVTDVASTKAQVLEWARELLPATVEFIGGHPMAGKELVRRGRRRPRSVQRRDLLPDPLAARAPIGDQFGRNDGRSRFMPKSTISMRPSTTPMSPVSRTCRSCSRPRWPSW